MVGTSSSFTQDGGSAVVQVCPRTLSKISVQEKFHGRKGKVDRNRSVKGKGSLRLQPAGCTDHSAVGETTAIYIFFILIGLVLIF